MGKARKTAQKKIDEQPQQKVQNQPQPKSDKPEIQEKTQPIAKPKKYLKKSIDALQRIQRSKHQKIFLLTAERDPQYWKFAVLGTSGSQYHVTASTSMHCTCIDFRMKKKPCKHIFFIVTQVAQNEELLDYFKSSSSSISKAAYKVLDEQLTDRLRSRMAGNKKEAKEIDLKDDTDCTICFTEMDKQNEDLEDCHTCNKYFHVVCINAWKNHNPTCPLCRSQFKNKGPNSDPLGQLKGIKL